MPILDNNSTLEALVLEMGQNGVMNSFSNTCVYDKSKFTSCVATLYKTFYSLGVK